MEITEIKQQLSILRVLEYYGLQSDKNNSLKCPFHNDKTPSMLIYPKSNTYCCFSSNCNAGTGDQIQFIELQEKQGKHQALVKAQEILGVSVNTPSVSSSSPPKAAPQVIEKKEEETTAFDKTSVSTVQSNNEIFDYDRIFSKLKQNIGKSPRAKQYIEERCLQIEKLEIGYNAETFPQLKDCIVFPLKDKFNKVVSLYGRALSKGHYYTANRKGLYPSYPNAETRTLILTESVIDAATLIGESVLGSSNLPSYSLLALYGTNGFTQEHTEAVSQLKHLQEVILWFDGDEAGKKAVEKYREELKTVYPKLLISQVETPENEDINSLLQGHDSSILTHLLDKRRKDIRPLTLKDEVVNKSLNLVSSSLDRQSQPRSESKLNSSNPDFIFFLKSPLKFTLLGGISLTQSDRMRVTLKVNIEPQLSPLQSIRHNLDLYNDDQVEKFCRKASEKLEIGTSHILQSISELIEELERYRVGKLDNQKDIKPTKRILSQQRITTALNYLKQPDLLKRTNQDIAKSGVIGEEINRLLMFLVFTSRMRKTPLHIISLGASGTGKTYLQEKISELIPRQDKLEITMLSDNAFYYFGQTELKNKLILIEDMDGAENVLYPLRELMSKKRITKTIPIKDSKGNLKTITLQVEGPICVAGTTTKEQIYEDNANRSLLIYLDGSTKHQEAIMDYQRKISAGEINKQQEDQIKELFKDIQSVLRPIEVVNPYATKLKIPDEVFKPLRTNTHYLLFIECVTFYHQHQRAKVACQLTGEEYIETTIEDIEQANQLLKNVLLAKADELNGACRKFFEVLKTHLKQEGKQSFYAGDIRQALRTSLTTLKRHLYQLTSNGYVKIVGGDKFRKGYEYEVVSFEEYQALQTNIQNALDEALKRLKNGE